MIIQKYFLYFLIYSIVGWLWEVFLCLYEDKKFVNRGFFNGPYCPIYGCGALLDIIILGKIKNAGLLFVLGVLLTGVLEYLTSFFMEKLFHAKWWDYSERRYNINGRVCLAGMICFGSMSVILIRLVHPAIIALIGKIPSVIMNVLAIILGALFLWDCVHTLVCIKGFDKKLAEFNAKIQENLQANLEKARSFGVLEKAKQEFSESELKQRLEEAVAHFKSKRMNRQERRIIKAFPKMRSIRYNDILERIRNKK